MKKFLIVFLLLFIHCSFLIAQTGWIWKYPYPQGNSINKIFTVPSGKLYGICNYGTLMTSTNGGLNWNFVNKMLGIKDDFVSSFIYNDNTVFIGSGAGKIIKTTNSGISWNIIYDFNQQYGTITAIDFRNINTGYIIYQNNYVYKTTNGGINWSQVFNQGHNLLDIEFISVDTGFVSSGSLEVYVPGIYKTVDGGLNWVSVYSSITSSIRDLKFINSFTGFASFGSYSLLKTTNRGLNWGYYGNSYYPDLNTVFFFDDNTTYATFFSFNFKITTNGGYNWITKQMPAAQVQGINFLNLNTGYLQGYINNLYFTSNAGDNWTLRTEPNGNGIGHTVINDGVFIDANIGFVVGMGQLIKRTTNQGENWQTIPCPQIGNNEGVDFINANTGFIAGGNSGLGILLKSTDGGMNWLIHKSFSNEYFSCIKFFNGNNGLIGSPHGPIYRTSDSGNSWSLVDSTLVRGVHSFFIQNSTTAYAVGDISNFTSKLLKTTDAGLSWNTILISSLISQVIFINNNTGFCAGQGVLKTTNGGQSWYRVLNESYIYGLDFINENVGYVTGQIQIPNYGSFIYRTTNGGAIWNGLDNPAYGYMSGVKFFNANTGIIYGEYSSILKTYDGGGNSISSISNDKLIPPTNFILYQNYPNPFNPSTKIKFDIRTGVRNQESEVKLIIYDMTGRAISILVDEQLQPGTYEVTFDGSNFASGVYFYQLRAGDFNEVKRAVLIK